MLSLMHDTQTDHTRFHGTQDAYLTALVDAVVTAAPVRGYVNLVYTLKRLLDAKVPFHPQFNKLAECVMSDLKTVIHMKWHRRYIALVYLQAWMNASVPLTQPVMSAGILMRPVAPPLVHMAQAMGAVRTSDLDDAFSVVFSFVHQAALPAGPHLDAICGEISAMLGSGQRLAPVLTKLASIDTGMCAHSGPFVSLVQGAITELEAAQRRERDPPEIPFNVCAPGCDVCRQIKVFCSTFGMMRTEIFRAGSNSKNRDHIFRMLEPYPHARLVDINTHSRR